MDNTFDLAGFIATEFANADEYARPVQRHRHELYVRALSDTDDMSKRHQLGALWATTPIPHYDSYLDASAYQSASRTLDPIKGANVGLFMSQSVMWLSSVDLLLDDIVLPRLLHSGWDPDQQEKYLDTVLWAIATRLLNDIPEDRVGTLLGARYARGSSDIAADESNIRRITGYLDEHLAVLPAGAADSGRRLVASEIAAALGAQRNELMLALRFAHDGSLPSLTDYLNSACGYPRILIAPIFALTPEATEAGEFSDWLPAAIACGRVTRIANDSGTFVREQIEGKPNSVAITLASLGYPLDVPYTRQSEPFQQAMQMQRELLDRETAQFFDRLTGIHPLTSPPVAQSHLLLAAFGFYRAVYEHGDFDLVTYHPMTSSAGSRQ